MSFLLLKFASVDLKFAWLVFMPTACRCSFCRSMSMKISKHWEEPNSGPWAQPFRGTYCYGFKSKAHKTSDFDHVSYSSDSSIQLFGGTHYNTNTIPIQLQSLLSGPVPCISWVNMSKCVKYHPKILKIVMCLKMWKSTQWQLY